MRFWIDNNCRHIVGFYEGYGDEADELIYIDEGVVGLDIYFNICPMCGKKLKYNKKTYKVEVFDAD